ncbi:ejaculatory bulb-specific protein 1 [Drosophila santomea]|uniref:ejaculatory bulb-specific protein 1 n=1 Tax=Drosophila santomea TaxID=129105 RepID=UPI001952A4C1|nr:ejaculatory bulb-specific protein 1 [Drosophila santomea]
MVRQLILVLSLILFCGSSHAIVSELARQTESAIQGWADIKMAPLRYLNVLFGANPGGLRGLNGRNLALEASLSTAANLQVAKLVKLLASGNLFPGGYFPYPGYGKIIADVPKGSDLITIIKNPRSYDPYLTPPGIPGWNIPVGWPRYPGSPLWPWGTEKPSPIRPEDLFPGEPRPTLPPGGNFPGFPPFPDVPLPPPGGPPHQPGGPPDLSGGPPDLPGGPPQQPGGPPHQPGGPQRPPGGLPPLLPLLPFPPRLHGIPGLPGILGLPRLLQEWILRGILPKRPVIIGPGAEVDVDATVNIGGGFFGNGGLLGTGIFGKNGLFGTGFLSGPSLDPFGIFTPIGSFFGALGSLFGFSPPVPFFGPFGPFGRGMEGSVTLDVGGYVPWPKSILAGILHPFLGFLG